MMYANTIIYSGCESYMTPQDAYYIDDAELPLDFLDEETQETPQMIFSPNILDSYCHSGTFHESNGC